MWQSFEDLEKLFALDLKELEESIDIEFSLGEHDSLWIGKTEDKVSGADIFWGISEHRQPPQFYDLSGTGRDKIVWRKES